MKVYKLKIAEEYTRYPAGRFLADGPYPGEKFRDELLVPRLKENDKVIVIIDGVRGYGSSFLEEAFGGMVRNGFFTKEELNTKLDIQYVDQSFESYKTEIWEYIGNAGKN